MVGLTRSRSIWSRVTAWPLLTYKSLFLSSAAAAFAAHGPSSEPPRREARTWRFPLISPTGRRTAPARGPALSPASTRMRSISRTAQFGPAGPFIGDRRGFASPRRQSSCFEPCPVPTCVTACSPDRAAVKLRVLAFIKGEMADPPGARRLVPTVGSSPAPATSWSTQCAGSPRLQQQPKEGRPGLATKVVASTGSPLMKSSSSAGIEVRGRREMIPLLAKSRRTEGDKWRSAKRSWTGPYGRRPPSIFGWLDFEHWAAAPPLPPDAASLGPREAQAAAGVPSCAAASAELATSAMSQLRNAASFG